MNRLALFDGLPIFATEVKANKNRLSGRKSVLGSLWALWDVRFNVMKKMEGWKGTGREKRQPKLFISRQTTHHWPSNKIQESYETCDLAVKIKGYSAFVSL